MALLELRNVSKRFGGVQALADALLSVEAGEVRGLVGENGSGKTTLLRILAGEVPPDEGEVRVNGELLPTLDANARLEAGVGVVFQEAHVCPELSVAENMMLGRLPTTRGRISWGRVTRSAQRILDDARLPLDARRRVRSISQDAQHLTEVARVLARDCQVIAFDETTASLTQDYVKIVFDIIRRRRREGGAIVFISHRLHEVFEICDSITVLRDGQVRGLLDASTATEDAVIRLMVGRDLERQFFRPPAELGDVRLSVREVSTHPLVGHISFDVRSGEVVGIGGLVGSGRSELLEALFGLRPRTGTVEVSGRVVRPEHPREAIQAGIGFVPEDRRSQGLAVTQTVRMNATMVYYGKRPLFSLTSRAGEDAVLAELTQRLQLKAAGPSAPVRTLSGGNQQKVVLGRWLAGSPPVLLLDEPTRGIDVGTKREIYALLDVLAKEGAAIVLVSSELPELIGLCDRVLVLREGRLVGEFAHGATEEELAAAMAAEHHGAGAADAANGAGQTSHS
jgi:ABC-type sugar transport system ATPase subunit